MHYASLAEWTSVNIYGSTSLVRDGRVAPVMYMCNETEGSINIVIKQILSIMNKLYKFKTDAELHFFISYM